MPQIQQPYPMAPGAKLDFEWDWRAWLAQGGDSIVSIVAVAGEGVNLGQPAQVEPGVVSCSATLAPDLPQGRLTYLQVTIETATRKDSRSIQVLSQVRSTL